MSGPVDHLGLHARRQPTRLAARDLATGRGWTYAALDRAVGQCVSVLAARAARALAALGGRRRVGTDDAVAAGRLVFAPRATRVPQPNPSEEPNDEPAPRTEASPGTDRGDEPPPLSPPAGDGGAERGAHEEPPQPEDVILAATQAAIPRGLLARLRDEPAVRGGSAPASWRNRCVQ